MELNNAVVLVTGANRGLGRAFAQEALARGARKVYAGARDPDSVTLSGVVPVRLDVTRQDEVDAVARQCADVTLLINNAGVAAPASLLQADGIEALHRHMETNVFGMLRVTRAFAPILAANGGGALVNVLSIVSWIASELLAPYSVSKSAAWSLTNGLRHELRGQGTQVLGLHMGYVDTDLTRGLDVPKSSPQAIAALTLDALTAGQLEVLGDEATRLVKQGLSATEAVYLQPRG